MAADSCVYAGGIKDRTVKIARVDGHIIGFAGVLTQGKKFIAWYRDREREAPSLEDTEILVLRNNGKIEYWDSAMFPLEVKGPIAIGSGAAAALGAMYAGKPPHEAVKIACKIDSYTSHPVKVIHREVANV